MTTRAHIERLECIPAYWLARAKVRYDTANECEAEGNISMAHHHLSIARELEEKANATP